jgi:hypothetical protein
MKRQRRIPLQQVEVAGDIGEMYTTVSRTSVQITWQS